VCLDRLDNQAGVDNVWEQYKLKARKMLENGDDWAREQSTATKLVPGAQRMGSPTPAHERWGSHPPAVPEPVEGSSAPKMMAGHHFIRENGELRSENALLAGIHCFHILSRIKN